MIALSFSALSFLLVDCTMQPGPGSTSISVPFRFSHKPPEARIWDIIMNLAPPVPRKVIVSPGGVLVFIDNVTIDDNRMFDNAGLSIPLTPEELSTTIATGSKKQGDRYEVNLGAVAYGVHPDEENGRVYLV